MSKVILISHTPEPEKIIASAAKLCYSDKTVEEIMNNQSPEAASSFIKKLMDLGHESPLEHISFTFGIEEISRTTSHQLVRHRIASYSQKSQRYVNENEFSYVIPPKIKNNKEALGEYQDLMRIIQEHYDKLVGKYNIPKEDARYVLPNATETSLIMTMNARSLLNFFAHRCCLRAQWEIRVVANKMLEHVRQVAPTIFLNAGASCIRLNYCPESTMSCGLYPTLQNIINKQKGE